MTTKTIKTFSNKMFCSFLLLLSFSIQSIHAELPDLSFQSYLSLSRNQGRTYGWSSSYTSLDYLIFPYVSNTIAPFLDLQVNAFDRHGSWGGNVGIGARFSPSFTDYIVGVNTYYDTQSYHHHTFNQVGLGLELLGCRFGFRLNGYIPFGDKCIETSSCRHEYEGGYFYTSKKHQAALTGVDFEIETCFANICCLDLDIFMGLGSYYYRAYDCCGKDLYGASYRLSTYICDRYGLNLYLTSDCVYKTRFMAEFICALPFARGCYRACNERFFQPVRRHRPLVFNSHCTYDYNW